MLKRRHGLNRWRYRGLHGMERWVGLGVIALSTSVAGSHYSEREIAGWWCDEHEAEKWRMNLYSLPHLTSPLRIGIKISTFATKSN